MLRSLCLIIILILPLSSSAIEHRSRNGDARKFILFRANPAALALKAYEGDIQVAILPFFSVGPAVTYLKPRKLSTSAVAGKSTDVSGWAFAKGGRANFYFAGDAISDSLYITGFAYAVPIYLTATNTAGKFNGDINASFYGAIIGHQWVWKWLSVAVGVGAMRAEFPTEVLMSNSNGMRQNVVLGNISKFIPTGELSLGIGF